MLKIQNYDKLFGKDMGAWRVGRVDEIETAYLIQLWKNNHDKMQVNLERTAIHYQYELWCWNSDYPTAIPIRKMLSIESIKDMNKLIDIIKLLIQNRL